MGYVKRRWIESMEQREEEPPVGHMKDLLITIHNGGDEAVRAVQEYLDIRQSLSQQVSDTFAGVPKWIPVSERLPDEEQEVLAWNGGGQCLKPWQGHVLCECKNGEWREVEERDLYPGVTHWMPLPEPPEVIQ